jgi:ubiquinone/menaquinone biosynthesis C-methylase UbiE
LKKFIGENTIRILDIGGGSGYFSVALYEYFKGKNCEIYVIDPMRYDTWSKFSEKVKFVQGTADDLSKIFNVGFFDIIFAKYVFHHFIKDTWEKTIVGMKSIIKQIQSIMKKNACFCIVDQFYNGLLGDTSASKMIYRFTKCQIPFLVKIFRKMGAESAGTGVCFLSKKMFLKLFHYAGFEIETLSEPLPTKMKWYRHIGLLLKTWNDGCTIVVKCGHCT